MLGKMIVSLSWSLLDIVMWVGMVIAACRGNWPAAIFCFMLAYYAEGKALAADIQIRLSERLKERMKDEDKA